MWAKDEKCAPGADKEPGGSGLAARGRGRPKVTSDSAQAAQILTTAKSLFLERGYGETRMSDVAACCHISKRTLYRHFAAKTDLLAAVIEEHRHSMLALPGDYAGLPLVDALERIFLVDIDEAAHAERSAFLSLISGEAVRHPEIHALIDRHGIDPAKMLLVDWLETERLSGRIDIDDAASVARMLMDMLFGAATDHPGNRTPPLSHNTRQTHQRRCIKIFVRGVETANNAAQPARTL